MNTYSRAPKFSGTVVWTPETGWSDDAGAVLFFYEHAGFSFDPATETEHDGKLRCARRLAEAEARLKAGPYFVDHVPDDVPWDGDVPYDGPLWIVTLYSVADRWEADEVLGSLGSVACEADDPYMRVVAAELAAEYLPADDDDPEEVRENYPGRN